MWEILNSFNQVTIHEYTPATATIYAYMCKLIGVDEKSYSTTVLNTNWVKQFTMHSRNAIFRYIYAHSWHEEFRLNFKQFWRRKMAGQMFFFCFPVNLTLFISVYVVLYIRIHTRMKIVFLSCACWFVKPCILFSHCKFKMQSLQNLKITSA